ncbi:major capsid protein, partial [Escherichia albertii]|uniref:major capsid protein n=1 Tax=Escherichia albertii TaxID=208962 RepID=UPI0021D509E0
MSMYTTAQLLAANEQKFKFDPLFLRLFFRESYPFTTEKVYLSQIPGNRGPLALRGRRVIRESVVTPALSGQPANG